LQISYKSTTFAIHKSTKPSFNYIHKMDKNFFSMYLLHSIKAKPILLLVFFSFFFNTLTAQNVKKIVYNDNMGISIGMTSETKGFDNIEVILSIDNTKKLSKKILKKMKKFGKWSKTAVNNNVTDFEKTLTEDLLIDCILFAHEDEDFLTNKNLIKTEFVIDNKGSIFLRLFGKYFGTIGTDIVASTIGSIGSISFIGQSIGYSSSEIQSLTEIKKKVQFDYSLLIPKEEIFNFINKIENARREIIIEDKEMKLTQKWKKHLFK